VPPTLSTTPCSYTTFPPFRALTHLPWHETNSFEFVSRFLNFYSPVGSRNDNTAHSLDNAAHSLDNALLLPDFPHIPYAYTASFARNKFVSCFSNFSEPGDARKHSAGLSLDNTLLLPNFPHIPCAYTASVARNEFVSCLSNFSELGDTRKDSAGHSLNNTLLLLNFPPIPCVDTSSLALNEFV
jgi:hypothetical protein